MNLELHFNPLKLSLILILAASLLFPPLGSPALARGQLAPRVPCILRVDGSLLSSGNGLTWATAYNGVQTAINAAALIATPSAPCQVWVKKGTYIAPGSSRFACFVPQNNVAVYGGFGGTETDLSQRSWQANLTVLSGNIGNPGLSTDNSEDVVYISEGQDSSAILDGFTIQDGYASGSYTDGAGIYIFSSSPTLANLYIQNNHANGNGGGVYVNGGSPTFTDVIIQNNTATYGAGVYLANSSSVTLSIAIFTSNSATVDGGGLFNDATSTSLTLTSASFYLNHADHGGGGAYINGHATLGGVSFSTNTADFGAGLTLDTNTGGLSLSNSSFNNNTAAEKGGGIYIYQSAPTLVNVLFYQNTSTNSGGGAIAGWKNNATLTNVTLSRNSAPTGKGGGIYNSENSHPVVRNSILWGDTGGEIYHDPGFTASTITITYSLVQGCKSGGSWNSALCGTDDLNNLTDGDPKFKDPAANNFHLKTCSLTIDRGNNTFVSGVPIDNDGNLRIFAVAVDLGPFETTYHRAYTPVLRK